MNLARFQCLLYVKSVLWVRPSFLDLTSSRCLPGMSLMVADSLISQVSGSFASISEGLCGRTRIQT